MARGLEAHWGGVGAGPGGAQGVVGGSVLPQGWVSSPAVSLALCMAAAAPPWGGCSPARHCGRGQLRLAKLGARS